MQEAYDGGDDALERLFFEIAEPLYQQVLVDGEELAELCVALDAQ